MDILPECAIDPYMKDTEEMERQLQAQGWGKNSVDPGFTNPKGPHQIAESNQVTQNDVVHNQDLTA